MLILTRKPGESIILGNDVRVKVIEVVAGGVRLGIEAPRDVSIVRAELHEEVAGANRRAAGREDLPRNLLDTLRARRTGRRS